MELYAKAEWQNPGGSVKDRAAARMIADGEASGRLRPGLTIVDATSGNTGIAYAMVGAARGYKVKLFLPDNASPERKLILRAFGAELVLTSPLEGTDGAIREVRRLVAEDPDRYFYPDQYSNDGNWRAHFDGTGPEIIEQTGGRITHFVAGLGTSGTFMGTGRALRQFNPSIKLISFQPDSPFHGLEGLKHMATAIVPAIYDPTLADENLRVSTEDAHRLVRRLARDEGLLVGISSGAALVAALTGGPAISRAACVVTVFPDGAEKYLSENVLDGRRVDGANGTAARCRRRGRHPAARRGDLSARVLRRPDRAGASRGIGVVAGDRRGAAAEHDRGGTAAAFSRPAVGLPPGRAAGGRARRRAARVLPLASRSSRPAVAVRPRSCLADFRVRDRLGHGRRLASDDGVVPERRSIQFRRGRPEWRRKS